MQYIDETYGESVAEKLNERKKMTGMKVKLCNDGCLYVLIPTFDGKRA